MCDHRLDRYAEYVDKRREVPVILRGQHDVIASIAIVEHGALGEINVLEPVRYTQTE